VISPRWTYSEANASRWKTLFDSFITGEQREQEIPLAGNASSIHSLKIRIGDALKYLADQFALAGNAAFKPYAELKPMLCFGIGQRGLVIKLRPRLGAVAPEDYKPLNLDAETLKRLTAMAQETKYTLADRLLFAETVRVERKVQNPKFYDSEKCSSIYAAMPSLVPSVSCHIANNY
jgi:hypothetical protein